MSLGCCCWLLLLLFSWFFIEVPADGGKDNGREGDGSVSLCNYRYICVYGQFVLVYTCLLSLVLVLRGVKNAMPYFSSIGL